jgi:glycosyltransferase involved in cell wall biosynthesis
LGIPYAINVQCASNFFFIHSDNLDDYRRWYQRAECVCFVSTENQHKVENNLAVNLTNAEIVANPFNVPFDACPDWPLTDPAYRVAVVGRVHFQSKGQDLVVDVMKQDKWRNRNIEVNFYGQDQGNLGQLEALIRLNGLERQLKYAGFVDDVREIWNQNHALLLPSRYEGAPLVVIEAMLCNRIGIVTDIGRNRELIEDGVSGFVADGAIIRLLDAALERAWQQRKRWQEMGEVAGQHIRQRYPQDPIRAFADRIVQLIPAAARF